MNKKQSATDLSKKIENDLWKLSILWLADRPNLPEIKTVEAEFTSVIEKEIEKAKIRGVKEGMRKGMMLHRKLFTEEGLEKAKIEGAIEVVRHIWTQLIDLRDKKEPVKINHQIEHAEEYIKKLEEKLKQLKNE